MKQILLIAFISIILFACGQETGKVEVEKVEEPAVTIPNDPEEIVEFALESIKNQDYDQFLQVVSQDTMEKEIMTEEEVVKIYEGYDFQFGKVIDYFVQGINSEVNSSAVLVDTFIEREKSEGNTTSSLFAVFKDSDGQWRISVSEDSDFLYGVHIPEENTANTSSVELSNIKVYESREFFDESTTHDLLGFNYVCKEPGDITFEVGVTMDNNDYTADKDLTLSCTEDKVNVDYIYRFPIYASSSKDTLYFSYEDLVFPLQIRLTTVSDPNEVISLSF